MLRMLQMHRPCGSALGVALCSWRGTQQGCNSHDHPTCIHARALRKSSSPPLTHAVLLQPLTLGVALHHPLGCSNEALQQPSGAHNDTPQALGISQVAGQGGGGFCPHTGARKMHVQYPIVSITAYDHASKYTQMARSLRCSQVPPQDPLATPRSPRSHRTPVAACPLLPTARSRRTHATEALVCPSRSGSGLFAMQALRCCGCPLPLLLTRTTRAASPLH
jgi:hypothetical protein